MQRFAALFGPLSIASARGNAPHLVLMSYLPLHYTNKIEMLMARSLQERGWRVSVVANNSTAELASVSYALMPGIDVLRYEDFLHFRNTAAISRFADEAIAAARRSVAEFKAVTYRGAPVCLHAIASLTASQPDGVLGTDEQTLKQLRGAVKRSALLVDAADELFRQLSPTLVMSQEKGFVGTCETFYSALRNGIRFVQWVSCHEPESVMFKGYYSDNSRDHPFSISQSTWDRVSGTEWDERFRQSVLAEFDRGYKSGDWFKYKKLTTDQTFADSAETARRLGLDRTKKTAVIYSHILNDANLFYGVDLFPSGYEEWLVETVRAAANNPAVNWVLKLHPANVFRNKRLGYQGEYGELLALKKVFGEVPSFLKIVLPEEKLSPLSFFGATDWGVTVRGTIGMELPCFGIPVLTAGSGRYSGKGFTVDSGTSNEYLERIRSIHRIAPLTDAQTRLALLHAYFVFRARPAPYGALFGDTYPNAKGPRQRDIELRLSSVDQVISHPQMSAITDFLVEGNEDFLEPSVVSEAVPA